MYRTQCCVYLETPSLIGECNQTISIKGEAPCLHVCTRDHSLSFFIEDDRGNFLLDVFQELTIMTRRWEPGVAYSAGEVVEYQGQRYKVIQGHSSLVCVHSWSTSHFDLTTAGNDHRNHYRATGPQGLRPPLSSKS